MALDGTYTGLIATLTSWLNRGDLTADIPDYIALLEAQVNRRIRSKNVTVLTSLTLDAAKVVLPNDVKEPRSLFITSAGFEGAIEITSMTRYAQELKRIGAVAGRPQFAAIANDVLYLAPTPNATFIATLTYEPMVQSLAVAGSNWLFTHHPDIYLYGALVHASPFLRDDPRVPMFKDTFDAALTELELARDRSEYPNTPVERPRRAIG